MSCNHSCSMPVLFFFAGTWYQFWLAWKIVLCKFVTINASLDCWGVKVSFFLEAIWDRSLKLWKIIICVEVHAFIPVSVTLTYFQGHSDVDKSKRKFFSLAWSSGVKTLYSCYIHMNKFLLKKCFHGACMYLGETLGVCLGLAKHFSDAV